MNETIREWRPCTAVHPLWDLLINPLVWTHLIEGFDILKRLLKSSEPFRAEKPHNGKHGANP